MIIKKLINSYFKRKDPVSYYRKKGAIIGNECVILSNDPFGSEPYLIKIGDNVRIASGVKFVTHDGGVWVLRHMYPGEENIDLFGKIEIGNNVHIGINAIIMPNVKIGNNSIIGAGAIVTRDIPDNSVAVGIPAKKIGDISDYYERHKSSFKYTHHLSSEEKEQYLKNELIKND